MPAAKRPRRGGPEKGHIPPPVKQQVELGRASVLKEHPLFDEIDNMLRSRYSPTTVVSLLRWQYGDAIGKMPPLPSVRTLERYRADEIAEVDLLPARLIEKRVASLNTKLDLFESLTNLYITAEERLARVLEVEDGFPMVVPGVDKAYETALAIAQVLWRIGQDIGIHPRGGRTVFAPSVRATAVEESISDEEMENVIAALYFRRHGRLPPELNRPAPRIIDGIAQEDEADKRRDIEANLIANGSFRQNKSSRPTTTALNGAAS